MVYHRLSGITLLRAVDLVFGDCVFSQHLRSGKPSRSRRLQLAATSPCNQIDDVDVSVPHGLRVRLSMYAMQPASGGAVEYLFTPATRVRKRINVDGTA